MNKKTVITRFAPSPTGYLHIGSLRTALYSYLWARKHGGSFRLRIEDTDQERFVPGADTHLIRMMKKLGLEPDGEIVYQSKRVRKNVYADAAERLVRDEHAYFCFCTPERLTELRKEQIANKHAPGYDGLCRDLPAAERSRRRTTGEASVVRLMIPHDGSYDGEFKDEIHGTVSFKAEHLEDAVLLKSDGFPTYHLACVVDDHEMNITHVVRGEEWLPSAPLHALLYRYLGYEPPLFYHLPLILNPDRSKLSKRQGHVSVDWYLSNGYLKEALINYAAFLGWNPGDDREIFSLSELISEFDLAKVHRAGAIFNLQKLNWFNSWYIKNVLAQEKPAVLDAALAPFLPGKTAERRIALFTLFFERIESLSDLPILSAFLEKVPDYEPSLLIFKKSNREKTRKGLQHMESFLDSYSDSWTAVTLDVGFKRMIGDSGLSFGDVLWPLRVALSGLAASPPPADIAAYLGKEETLARIKRALQVLSS